MPRTWSTNQGPNSATTRNTARMIRPARTRPDRNRRLIDISGTLPRKRIDLHVQRVRDEVCRQRGDCYHNDYSMTVRYIVSLLRIHNLDTTTRIEVCDR